MWFWWALGSAVVSGISVTFNKRVLNKGVHSSVVALATFFILTLVSIPPLLTSEVVVPSDTKFFIAALTSAAVFSISKILSLNIFKHNNLSDVYPLAALAPVTLYIMSILFLSEYVKPVALVGILCMAIGVYIINFNGANKNPLHPFLHFFRNKYSIMQLTAILLSNISAISEKIAIQHTTNLNVLPLAFWENFFLVAITGTYVIKTNKNWQQEIKDNWLNLTIAGIIFSSLYFLVLLGFQSGPVSLVSAIKKLEVLFVLMISYAFLGDKPSLKVYVATFIMLIAVFLIKL